MALAKKCDRCGVHYDPYTKYGNKEENANGVQIVSYKNDGSAYISVDEYDLCTDCIKEINMWLKKEEPIIKSEYNLNNIEFEDVIRIYNPLRIYKAEITGEIPEGIAVTYENNERSGNQVGSQEAKVIFTIKEDSELFNTYDRVNVNNTGSNILTAIITVEDDEEPEEGPIKGPGESVKPNPGGMEEAGT